MGTNFYWKTKEEVIKDDPKIHIGKRSAAGMYCWDCGTTLCKEGTYAVHSGSETWAKMCPICGKEPAENFPNNSVGRELGFTKEISCTGVSSCSSFTWSMMSHKEKIEKKRNSKAKLILDEYGREYTPKEFLDMLKSCPIQQQTPGEFS